MVMDFQQLHPHVALKIGPNDPLRRDGILSRLGKLEGNNEEAWEEGRSVHPPHSHEAYEASFVPWFRYGI
jgi:hypothetical protein